MGWKDKIMLIEIPMPIKGINYTLPDDKIQSSFSPYMLNVRAFDTLERKIRLGQRPGMDKMYSQQIGGTSEPIVWMGSIPVID